MTVMEGAQIVLDGFYMGLILGFGGIAGGLAMLRLGVWVQIRLKKKDDAAEG